MSGKKSKVIQFPNHTRKKIVCQYSSGTTIVPAPSRKENKVIDYYREKWPAILGSILGTTMMFLTFYFAAQTLGGK
jgi:hypothetical protein